MELKRYRGLWFTLVGLLFLLAVCPSFLVAETKFPPLTFMIGEVEGTVEVQAQGDGPWQPVEVDQELNVGDRIRTGENSSLRLIVPGISSTELGPESEVEVQALSRTSREESTLFGSNKFDVNTITLESERGTINSSIRDHGNVETNYQIHTDEAVAGIRGTVFQLAQTEKGDVRVGVYRGSVDFATRKTLARKRMVQARQTSRLRPGDDRPSQPTPLEVSLEDELRQFDEETKRDLQVPPWLGDFHLAGQSFEQSIAIVYDEEQELTLSGLAEVQEEGRDLASIEIDGDFGSHTFTPSSASEPWEITAQPVAPAEGERRVLNLRLRAEDSEGIQSPVYTLKIILVHPEQQGAIKREGIQISPELAGHPLLGEPVVQRAIDRLASARTALIRRDENGYLELFEGLAEVQTVAGGQPLSDFRTDIEALFPFLSNPDWTMVIEDIAMDADRLQLVVSSEYSGQIVELLGLQPSSTEPDPNTITRRRPVESVRRVSTEQYLFDRGGGSPQLVSARIGMFVDDPTLYEANRQRARWQVKNALFGLFYAYEQGSVDGVAERVNPDFLNNDENGFRHGYSDFIDSVRIDLENLYDIAFSIRVQSIQFEGSLDRARAEIEWDRQARLGSTTQLWLSEDNSSVLQFRRNSPFRLARITGDAVMGLSSPRTGSTLVRGGTLDGTEFSPQVVDSSREVTNFSGDEFPELTEEETTEIANEGCVSGTVDSNPGSDQTWCDDVTVSANITIPAGVTVTVDPRTNLTITANETVSVEGTLNISSTTISHPSRQKTPGITYKAGSSGTINGSTFDDGDMYLLVSGGSVTAQNNTFNTYDTDDTDGGENPVRAYGGSLTFHNNSVKTAVNIGSSSGLEIDNDATVDLQGNTFEGSFSFYVQGRANFSGSLTSSSNDFLGGGNTTWGVVNESFNGGTMSFNNEIFRDLTRGICNICNGGDGEDLTVKNSDFIDNAQPGVAASGSFGTVTLEGNYFGGNNSNNCYTLDTSLPDDLATGNSQYEGADSILNPRNSPNRASDPGYGSCGV